MAPAWFLCEYRFAFVNLLFVAKQAKTRCLFKPLCLACCPAGIPGMQKQQAARKWCGHEEQVGSSLPLSERTTPDSQQDEYHSWGRHLSLSLHTFYSAWLGKWHNEGPGHKSDLTWPILPAQWLWLGVAIISLVAVGVRVVHGREELGSKPCSRLHWLP